MADTSAKHVCVTQECHFWLKLKSNEFGSEAESLPVTCMM